MLPDLDAICGEIRAHHRLRNFAMDARKASRNKLGGLLRGQFGWTREGAEKGAAKALRDTNAAAKAKAAAILEYSAKAAAAKQAARDARERGLVAKHKKLPDPPAHYTEWGSFAEGMAGADLPILKLEDEATASMERLAETLPVWSDFGAGIRGFSPRGLAVIVGEAGNLDNYATHSKLWKRMGVAVMGCGDGLDDHRQGQPGSGATAADWIAEGYSKRRRSRLYVIGDSLIKTQGPYRDVYLARKAYEVARAQELGLTVAPSAKIPAKRKEEFRSDGHVHHRAQRYMEKRLLRDLWRAWRVGGHGALADTATGHVPPLANSSEPPSAMVDLLPAHFLVPAAVSDPLPA